MSPELRSGFTTGAAMTAGALAVFLHRDGETELLLPDGKILRIPVERCSEETALVRKDAGDDPDATDGAEVEVSFRRAEESELRPEDHRESAGALTVMIRGGAGVGRVTRPGLAVPPGKTAVNPGPRRLLMSNLLRAGASGCWPLSVSVRDGEKIAEKTLNPVLGILGGISILGGGGIVHPCSNAAYAATISLQIRMAAQSGSDTVALVTGGRTEQAVLRDFPFLQKAQIVRIADFIAHALRSADRFGIQHVIVGCMPGKLMKYACGDENTHAHRTRLRPQMLRELGIPVPAGLELEKMDTMGELASHLSSAEYRTLLERLKNPAGRILQKWAGQCQLELALYGERGERI